MFRIVSKLLIVVSLIFLPFSASAGEKEAGQYVNTLKNDVFAIIKNAASDDEQKKSNLMALFQTHVDTKWMANFVLGRYLRDAEPATKTKFASLYHEFIMLSYVPKFKEYSGGDVEIQRITKSGDKEYTVQTLLKNRGTDKADLRVDYRLLENGMTFNVIDIIGEGVSLVTTQRNDFGSVVSQKGLDTFVGMLEKKVNSLKAAK